MESRLNIIQEIIEKLRAKTYLEIGLGNGLLFSNIRAPKKIGVDPKLLNKKFTDYFNSLSNLFSIIFRMTSEDFFIIQKKFLLKNGLDVVFIDGLHTFEQSLRDVLNSLKYLNENGVIIVHDCNPSSETIAFPTNSKEHAESLKLPDWDGRWCGDVWKTILYLRKANKDSRIFVLDLDSGLGIIFKTNFKNIKEDQLEEIKKLDYQFLEHNRKEILNLKNPHFFNKFINSISSSGYWNILYSILMKIDFLLGFLRKIKKNNELMLR